MTRHLSKTPQTPFYTGLIRDCKYLFSPLPLLLVFCSILISSCRDGETKIQIESGDADNTGYTALLTTLHDSNVQVDTLSFTKAKESFTYTFDTDSLYEAYIVVGNFEQYYPLDLQGRDKIRFHLEVASPHNCYDLDVAKKTGYTAFLKKAAPLLRSYDKALTEQDLDQASKEAKLVMQQFVSFASNLKDKERSRYSGKMDWAIEIMSLYDGGMTQLRQAVTEGTIDSALFSSEVYQIILTPPTTVRSDYPTLRAINKSDTIIWCAESYPQGRILFGSDVDWRHVQVPTGSRQSVTMLLPLGAIDSLDQIARRLSSYSYIVDAPEPLRVQLYRSLSPSSQAGVIHYSTDSNQRLVVDSVSYFRYNE